MRDAVRSPLLRCALDTVEEVFLACTTDGEILQWNAHLEEVAGYSGEEISEMSLARLTGEEGSHVKRRVREARGEGRTRFRSYLETKEEGRIPYSFTAALCSGGEDTLICLGGREERYRRIFEEALEGIAITTPDGDVVDANPAAREMFGYAEGEVPALYLPDLYANPEERQEIVETLRREGAISQREVEFRKAGGKEFVGELSMTTHPGGVGDEITEEGDVEPVRYLAFFRDVTERKRAEKVLKESEEKFRTLAESALVGITLIQDGVYEYVNPAMAEITGYSREELIGASPKLSAHPEDWPQVERQIERRLEGETQDVRYETRVVTKAGETRHLDVAGSRITYQGKPAVIATALDVTERRRMRRELIRVQEEERRRIGQELHDGVASQLTGARLRLSNLSDRIQEIEEAIEENTGELRKLSRGLRPGGLAEGDLLAALKGLASSTEGARFVSRFGAKDGEGVREGSLEEAHVEADSHRNGTGDFQRRLAAGLEEEAASHLYRIAQEAVSNARLHGQAGQIIIRLREEEGTLALEVEDDGVGFESEEIDKYASLGLRSMRHRADLIGADLAIESSPGTGTHVRVRLPL